MYATVLLSLCLLVTTTNLAKWERAIERSFWYGFTEPKSHILNDCHCANPHGLKGGMLGHDRTCRAVDILKVTHKRTAVSDAACLTSLLWPLVICLVNFCVLCCLIHWRCPLQALQGLWNGPVSVRLCVSPVDSSRLSIHYLPSALKRSSEAGSVNAVIPGGSTQTCLCLVSFLPRHAMLARYFFNCCSSIR